MHHPTGVSAKVDTTVQKKTDHPILAPCSRFDSRYRDKLGFREKYIKNWPKQYHDTVNTIIEDHLKPPELQCDAPDYESLLKPGEELKKLATTMPTWSDPQVRLTRYDLGRVLLEYLRVYECALNEYASISLYDTAKEIGREEDEGLRQPLADPEMARVFLNIFMSGLSTEDADRLAIIDREKILAREALTRTLSVVAALDRLRPVEMELQCMQQMSLDIRNVTALSAEASACLPRVWNAKDILRDLKE